MSSLCFPCHILHIQQEIVLTGLESRIFKQIFPCCGNCSFTANESVLKLLKETGTLGHVCWLSVLQHWFITWKALEINSEAWSVFSFLPQNAVEIFHSEISGCICSFALHCHSRVGGDFSGGSAHASEDVIQFSRHNLIALLCASKTQCQLEPHPYFGFCWNLKFFGSTNKYSASNP